MLALPIAEEAEQENAYSTLPRDIAYTQVRKNYLLWIMPIVHYACVL